MPEMSLSFAIEAVNRAKEGLNSVKEQISGLEGEAAGAHGAMSGLGQDVEDLGGKADGASSGGLGGLVSKLGGIAGPALAGGAALGIAAGAIDASIDKTSELAESTEKLSAALGETPEHSSELLFAFSQMGLSSDQANKDLDKFSKGLAGLAVNEDGTTSPSTALTKQLGQMGITLQDATGQALPMQQVLGQLADKFKDMPDGPEKTALAMQLFGKSGAELIPFLDQGSAGLTSLYQESDKLGLTLTGNTIEAVHQTTQAHREMSAAVDGLEVQIGTALMPVVAALATALASFVVWINTDGVPMLKQFMTQFAGVQTSVQQLVQFVQENWGTIKTVMQPLVDFIKDVLIADINTLKDVVKTDIDLIKGSFQIIIDLIHGNFGQAWQDLKKLVGQVIGDVVQIVHDQLQPIINIATGIVTAMRNGISGVLDGIKGDLVSAWTTATSDATSGFQNLVQGAEDKAKDLLSFVAGIPQDILNELGSLATTLYNAGIDLIKGLENGIINEAKNLPGQVGSAVQGAINSIPGAGSVLSHIPGLAAGGIVNEPTLAVVGEHGPEAVIPLAGLSTTQPQPLPSGGTSASGVGGGSSSSPLGGSGGLGSATLERIADNTAHTAVAVQGIPQQAHGDTGILYQVLGNIDKNGFEVVAATQQSIPHVVASAQQQTQNGALLSQLNNQMADAWNNGQWTDQLATVINTDLTSGNIGQALLDMRANTTQANVNTGALYQVLGNIDKNGLGIIAETDKALPHVVASAQAAAQNGAQLDALNKAVAEAWNHGLWTDDLASALNTALSDGQIGAALTDVNTTLATAGVNIVTAVSQATQILAAHSAAYQQRQAMDAQLAADSRKALANPTKITENDTVGVGLAGSGGTNTGAVAGAGAGATRMAHGGLITEPIFGLGASGRTYQFGENGPERVTPGAGGAGPGIVINVSALDAAGVASAMPTIARQLQLHLQRSGYTGLT